MKRTAASLCSRARSLGLTLFAAACLTACGAGDVEGDGQSEEALASSSLTAPVCSPMHTSLICLHFTNTSVVGRDYAIRNEVVRLIDAVPAKERITGTFFALGDAAIGDAIIHAHWRGVVVRLTLDGGNATDPNTAAARKVYAALGASRVKYCGSGADHGCITSHPSGIAHTKLLTFSRTTAPDGHAYDDVSWVGSYNAVEVGGGANASNNTVTSYNSPLSYAGYNATLDTMWNEDHFPRNAYFDASGGAARGYFYDANARTEAYFSPSPIATTDEGLLSDQFARITPGPGCAIRVMHAEITPSMDQTIQRIVDLKKGGCSVIFMVSAIDPGLLSKLHAAGIEVRKSHNMLHDKVVMFNAVYDGSTRKIFLTGSHNFTTSSSYKSDEVLVRIYDDTLWGSPTTGMLGHFLDAWYASNTTRL